MKNQKVYNTLFSIYMPSDMANELAEIAELNGVSRNKMLLDVIRNWLRSINQTDDEIAEALEVFDEQGKDD